MLPKLPPSVPPNISGSVDSYTNYANYLEVKNYTDGTLTMSGGYIHNLNDPVLSTDAANKQYVLDNVGGDSGSVKTWKNAVQAASISNITVLSGIQFIDGVNLNIDDRVLVKDQVDPSQNGIYLVASGLWSRTLDASTNTPVQASGSAIYVIAGTVNVNKLFTCNTTGAGPSYNPVLYGTPITFIPYGQSTPGGGSTQVQYNNSGVLDGSVNLTWDGMNLKTSGLETNSIEPLAMTSDVNLYTTHEAPIILGNTSNPTLSLVAQTGSGVFTMSNQSDDRISLVGSNRASGTGTSISIVAGSGSLGGSMLMLTGSSTVGAGPPIMLRPGNGSTIPGNVIVNPVTTSESISTTTGSLVVRGGVGITGSIVSGGTLTGTILLPSGELFVGSALGVATPTNMSGDATITNVGALTLASVTSAGTYSRANITVDTKGRVIAASNGPDTVPGGASGVIQYNNSGIFGGVSNFTTGGADLVGGTSAQLYIANSSNLTGSIGPLSVAGSVYIARSLIIGETLGANLPLSSGQIFVGSASNIATRAVMTGDAGISNTGALTLSSITTAGTFSNANITIDAKGRVISAAAGSSGTPGGSSGALQYNNSGVLGGTSLWTYGTSNPSGTPSDTLISTGNSSLYIGGTGTNSIYTSGGIQVQKTVTISNTSGSPNGLTVTGNIEATSSVISDSISDTAFSAPSGGANFGKSLVVAGTITGNQILAPGSLFVGSSAGYAVSQAVSGDATLSNVGALTLASVITAGTFTNANISFDSKGRILVASSGLSGAPGGTVGALQYNNNGVLGGASLWTYGTSNPYTFSASNTLISTGSSSLYIGGTDPASIYTAGGMTVSKDLSVLGNTTINGTAQFTSLLTANNAVVTRDLVVNGTITGNQVLPSASIFVGSSAGYAVARPVTGDASISNVGALTLASVITAGTYTSANISVDAKGRVVVASSGLSGAPGGSIGSLQYNNSGVLGGASSWFYNSSNPITGVSNTLYSTGSSSLYIGGTDPFNAIYSAGGVTVDKKLTVNGSAAASWTDVSLSVGGIGQSSFSGGITVAATADSTSTSTGSINTLGGVGIAKSLTVGGTITGNQILPSGNIFVGSAAALAAPVALSGDASLSNTGALTLASVVTSGTFTNANISVDAKGRVTNVTNGTATAPGGSTGALQYNNSGAFGGVGSWSYITTNPYTGVVSNTLVSTGSSSLYVGGTADSTSLTTGAVTTSGGAAIAKSLTVGGTTTSGSLNITGTSIVTALTASGQISDTSITDSILSVTYLVVGGGGSGATSNGGGGGGGFLTGSTSISSCLISVGVGGSAPAAVTFTAGNNGGNSSIGTTVISIGGGGGGAGNGTNGGSGSGAGANGGTGGLGTVGQGNNGGAQVGGGSSSGGGGGGAGTVGSPSVSSTIGGAGGDGLASSISGSSVTYAAGGGGAGTAGGGAGGSGGGGAGGNNASGANATGIGCGGGGGSGSNRGGTGSDGIVIITYPGIVQLATGGVVTTVGGTTTVHTFTSSGTFTITGPSITTAGGIYAAKSITTIGQLITSNTTASTSSTTGSLIVSGGTGIAGALNVGGQISDTSTLDSEIPVTYLLIAGGGGGGGGTTGVSGGGAGGAGGLLNANTTLVYSTVTVGAGGAGGANGVAGTKGSNSVISGVAVFTAIGGGLGGSTGGGQSGGSGGGGGAGGGGSGGGAATAGQGNAGGGGAASNTGAGGGGGSNAVGSAGVTTAGGAGGSGITNNISGSNITYAGGGGGGGTTGGSGGSGGGGAGGTSTIAGANATGIGSGGGGGGTAASATGGNGSAGIVVIAYLGSTVLATGGTITMSGGNVIHTFTSSGIFAPIASLTTTGGLYVSKSVAIAGATASTTTTTGALLVAGGVGIVGAVNAGGKITTTINTASLSTTSGALIVTGGAGIGGNMYIGGNLNIAGTSQFTSIGLTGTANVAAINVSGTTDSISSTTGALTVSGGVGITKSLTVGGNLNIAGTSQFTSIGLTGTANAAAINVSGTTDSISSTTGALTVSGGVGITKSLTVGGTVTTSGFNATGTSAYIGNTLYSMPITYLVVAGGGGGGNTVSVYGGGGGGGGFITNTQSINVTPTSTQSMTITVGAGGAANTNGSNSVLSGTGITTETAIGGGNGNGSGNGGSGGGGTNSGGGTPPGTGTAGQGNGGGSNSTNSAGGGGGAGTAGISATANVGGGGGYGSVFLGTYYAGGGGGAATTGGVGGSGGGGLGGNGGTNSGAAGTANTGGGGGGSVSNVGGALGGSGVVILSIPTVYYNNGSNVITGSSSVLNTDYTVTTSGANTILTFKTVAVYTYTYAYVSNTVIGTVVSDNLTVLGNTTLGNTILGNLTANNIIGRTSAASAGSVGEIASFTVTTQLFVASSTFVNFSPSVVTPSFTSGVWFVSLSGIGSASNSAKYRLVANNGSDMVILDQTSVNGGSNINTFYYIGTTVFVSAGTTTIRLQVSDSGGANTFIRSGAVLLAVRIA
jgi:hypothetical protein